MATTRVFKSGNSQAVRIPKALRISGAVVEIFRRGDEIVLRESRKGPGMGRAFELLAELPADLFAESRKDTPPQRRQGH